MLGTFAKFWKQQEIHRRGLKYVPFTFYIHMKRTQNFDSKKVVQECMIPLSWCLKFTWAEMGTASWIKNGWIGIPVLFYLLQKASRSNITPNLRLGQKHAPKFKTAKPVFTCPVPLETLNLCHKGRRSSFKEHNPCWSWLCFLMIMGSQWKCK